MTSARAWGRVTVCDLKRQCVEVRGARDQPYRNFERRVGVHAVFDGVEDFMIL